MNIASGNVPIEGDEPSEFDAASTEFASAADNAPADAAAIDADPDDGGPGDAPAAGHPAAPDPAAPTGPAGSTDTNGSAETAEELLARLRHENSSLKGRLSAQDRMLAMIRQQQQPGGGASQPNEGTEAASDAAGMSDEELERLREDYPEIAAPILAKIDALQRRVGQLQQPVEALTQHAAAIEVVDRVSTLEAAHPDWEVWAKDPRWGSWSETQPRAVQEALARASMVDDPAEAAWVLGQFKAAMGTPLAANGQPLTPAADPRRQRQLDAARSTGGNVAGAYSQGVPDDFDAAARIFEERAEREERARKR